MSNLRHLHLSWRRKADGEWDPKGLDRVVSSKIRRLLGDGHAEEQSTVLGRLP